jgi:hypothetical protein
VLGPLGALFYGFEEIVHISLCMHSFYLRVEFSQCAQLCDTYPILICMTKVINVIRINAPSYMCVGKLCCRRL